jgi:hypothetical protein
MLLCAARTGVNRCNPPAISIGLYIHGWFTVLLPASDASVRRYVAPYASSSKSSSAKLDAAELVPIETGDSGGRCLLITLDYES